MLPEAEVSVGSGERQNPAEKIKLYSTLEFQKRLLMSILKMTLVRAKAFIL